jgi:xylulokinase
MAAVQNGGLALDWVRRMFTLDWETFFAMAGKSSAPGLSFLPFLTGERGAVAPPSASGAWVGLTETTTRDQLVRAAVEGLAFCVRRCLELLTAEGAPVRLSGGGARSPVVRDLVSAAMSGPVRHDEERSASAIGAAMLAASGVGDRIARRPQAEPDPATHDRSPVGAAPPGRRADLDDAYQLWLSRLASLR